MAGGFALADEEALAVAEVDGLGWPTAASALVPERGPVSSTAASEALAVAEAPAVVGALAVAEADGELPNLAAPALAPEEGPLSRAATPKVRRSSSLRSPGLTRGALTALASLASRAAVAATWARVSTETEAGRASGGRSS